MSGNIFRDHIGRLLRVHAKLLQLCPTLWDPMDCNPTSSSVYGSGLPYPPTKFLPEPGIKPGDLMSLISPTLVGSLYQ